MAGLQHAGFTMHEEIRKVRNPLMFPVFIMKKIFEGNKRFGGESGINLGLAGYVICVFNAVFQYHKLLNALEVRMAIGHLLFRLK